MKIKPTLHSRKYLLRLTIALSALSSYSQADIVFSAKIAGPVTNIYTIDKQNAIHKITDNHRWRDLKPNVGKNGDIVFMSNREKDAKIDMQRQAENFDLYLFKNKSKKIEQVTHEEGHELSPQFSPNENMLAYIQTSDKKHILTLLNPKTGKTSALMSAENIYDFSWSPKGNKIAASLVNEDSATLSVFDIESNTVNPIYGFSTKEATNKNSYNTQITSVSWSPDGNYIAFITHPLKRGVARNLMVYNLNTQKASIVSDGKNPVQDGITWSADSKTLLYAALVDYEFYYDEKSQRKAYKGGMQIFATGIKGNPTQLTQGDHVHKSPVFSPDGKQIAFTYGETLRDRTFSLRTMDTKGAPLETLFKSVAPSSTLIWN